MPEEDPKFYAKLYQWSAQASLVAFEMVLPAVIGVILDLIFGTIILFVILGAMLGMVLGFWHLIGIARKIQGISNNSSDNSSNYL